MNVLTLENKSVREILNKITEIYPQYSWKLGDDVINLLPKSKLWTWHWGTHKSLLERPIREFDAQNTSSAALPAMLCNAAGISNAPRILIGITPANLIPISVHLENVTLREALNEVAKADGKAMWTFGPLPPDATFCRHEITSWRGEHVYRTRQIDLDRIKNKQKK